jgi:hypothetical protein
MNDAMNDEICVTKPFHYRTGQATRKVMREGEQKDVPERIPRITRLMALAIRIQELVDKGDVTDYAEMARHSQVTRARMTQIMDLLLLAPDIQAKILNLPRTTSGRDPVSEKRLRSIAAIPDWGKQRRAWEDIRIETIVSLG